MLLSPTPSGFVLTSAPGRGQVSRFGWYGSGMSYMALTDARTLPAQQSARADDWGTLKHRRIIVEEGKRGALEAAGGAQLLMRST